MFNLIVRFLREDSGQDLIEYAFLASGIGIAALLGVQALGTAIDAYYDGLAAHDGLAVP